MVSDAKAVKNRLHIDIHASGDRTDPIETRKKRVDAEADRLVGLGATNTVVMYEKRIDHYAVGMKDPEGNEFDIN
ncbi:VOC family protein [Streptomyces sp. NPDC058470]|uniref:VOC family protein n=1 Tax=Streptomyces sp. NPDC058470 TaxID=3346515 RepID=UPI0036464A9D